jgi:septal ring factor EnvC (AmiA/AmiB activator)
VQPTDDGEIITAVDGSNGESETKPDWLATDFTVTAQTKWMDKTDGRLDNADGDLAALMAGTTPYQQAQAKRLDKMDGDLAALMAGTTLYQQAQTKKLERLEKMRQDLAAVRAGTTEYQQEDASKVRALEDWRLSIMSMAKFSCVLLVAGGASVQLFM